MGANPAPAARFSTSDGSHCGQDILRHAYALARANAGAPGVDDVQRIQQVVHAGGYGAAVTLFDLQG